MAAAGKDRGPHGRAIHCAGSYRVFIPAPLPPPIQWSDRLVSALSHADLAVGQLAGEGVLCRQRGRIRGVRDPASLKRGAPNGV